MNYLDSPEFKLQQAAGSGNLNRIKQLLQSGAEPTPDALYKAAGNGHLEVVNYLLGIGVEPWFQAENFARGNGHDDIAKSIRSKRKEWNSKWEGLDHPPKWNKRTRNFVELKLGRYKQVEGKKMKEEQSEQRYNKIFKESSAEQMGEKLIRTIAKIQIKHEKLEKDEIRATCSEFFKGLPPDVKREVRDYVIEHFNSLEEDPEFSDDGISKIVAKNSR